VVRFSHPDELTFSWELAQLLESKLVDSMQKVSCTICS